MAGVKVMKWLWVTLVFGAVISCGGGNDDSDGYSNASLKGVHYGTRFSMNSSGWRATIMSATFDGVDTTELDQQFAYFDPDMDPAEGTGTDNLNLVYAVNADGAMQIGSGLEATDGLVGSGADAFVSARINSADNHSVGFFITAPAAGSWDGTPSGDYHAIGFSPYWTEVSRVTFEPDGDLVVATSYHTGTSSIREAGRDGGGTYEIDIDGKATLTGRPSEDPTREPSEYLIWFSADRTLFVAASATDPNDQKIHVGMKAGSGHTAASLKGTYAFATLISTIEADDEVASTALGTLTFDGVGGVTVHGTAGGGAGDPIDNTGSYRVNSDGTFTVTMMGETERDGVMSADGKTIAFARMDSVTQHSIGVGVRR